MPPSEILRAKLNLETAQLAWPELERHFARGVVIKVAPGMELVDAALSVAENNAATVEAWLAEGRPRRTRRRRGLACAPADVLGGGGGAVGAGAGSGEATGFRVKKYGIRF